MASAGVVAGVMPTAPAEYSIVRVNGRTAHNSAGKPNCYVEGGPPAHPETEYDYVPDHRRPRGYFDCRRRTG